MARQAGIYVRISRDDTGDRLGVTRQADECRALAERLGYEVAGVYEDNDVSASKGKRREAYEELLADVESRKLDAVIAWHPDRLHRAPIELERFIDVVESAKANVHTVAAGAYDLSTPSGRMSARIVGNVARYEVEQKAARSKAKNRQEAQEGKYWIGRDRMYGYTLSKMPEIVETEAEFIRQAAERILEGKSVTSTARWLNDNGSLTTAGNPWNMQAVAAMLTNPTLAALRSYDGDTYQGAWEPILTVEQHKSLEAIIHNEARKVGTGRRVRETLLPGFLFCAECGMPMRSAMSKKEPYYACKKAPGKHEGCGMIIARHNVDAIVKDVCFNLLLSQDEEAEPTQERSEAAMRINDLEERLAKLQEDYYVKQTVNGSIYDAASASLAKAIEEAKREYYESNMSQALAEIPKTREALEAAWEANDLEWKRGLIATLIERVEVKRPIAKGRASKAIDRVTVTSKYRTYGEGGIAAKKD